MTTTETPTYFYIEPATWDSWVAALGFAAASKLVGACMSYFFSGELGPDVKLTKTAAALFEGERAKLDSRRAKVAAKATQGAKGGRAKTARASVKKSVDNSRDAGKTEGKSRKNLGKNSDNSPKTTHLPAETSTYQKPKLKLYPQTPAPSAGGAGSGGRGSGLVSQAELAELLAAGLGAATLGGYGRAV